MIARTADAVVIGGGPNGLVAANALVDAGWDVLLLEAADEVGGAVRTAEVTAPGFRDDLYSAFYPLAAASPVMRGLELDRHGLVWSRAPAVLAHALDDGRAALLEAAPEATAAGLDAEAPGDGEAWLDMLDQWHRVRDDVLAALFRPFPPVASLARLLRDAGVRGTLDLARLAVLPVRRLGAERFRGEGGPLLLAGSAQHADIPPDAAGSGVFGWLLAMLGQDVGYPVPRGGAGMLARALADRFRAAGGQVEVGTRVTRVVVQDGRAIGVLTADGTRVRARAVLADVSAPSLYRDLLGPRHVPARLLDDLDAFAWDHPTLKVNWALGGEVPWRAPEAGRAGTVHLGVDLDGFVRAAADLAVGTYPERPFLLVGQMTTADPTRSPAGTQATWAYTHLPHGRPDAAAVAAHVDRMEAALERVAPGFGERVLARHVQSPADLEASDANLVSGAVNGGTSALHQQLVFRPTPGLGRPETPIEGLYLASASAHPGGGVHGACGWNAARAALADAGPVGPVRRRLVRTAWGRLV